MDSTMWLWLVGAGIYVACAFAFYGYMLVASVPVLEKAESSTVVVALILWVPLACVWPLSLVMLFGMTQALKSGEKK